MVLVSKSQSEFMALCREYRAEFGEHFPNMCVMSMDLEEAIEALKKCLADKTPLKIDPDEDQNVLY